MTEQSARIADFRNRIIDEIIYALGYARDGWQRKVLGPFFWTPANRFSKIILDFDLDVERHGVQFASVELIKPFVKSTKAVGIENIPEREPLVIASNHPGVYDSFVTTSYLSREDIKVVVSWVPFLMNLPACSNYLTFTSTDTHKRIRSVREILRHLKNGGVFPNYATNVYPRQHSIITQCCLWAGIELF